MCSSSQYNHVLNSTYDNDKMATYYELCLDWNQVGFIIVWLLNFWWSLLRKSFEHTLRYTRPLELNCNLLERANWFSIWQLGNANVIFKIMLLIALHCLKLICTIICNIITINIIICLLPMSIQSWCNYNVNKNLILGHPCLYSK